MYIFNEYFETKTVVAAGFIMAVGVSLPITIFIFNQPKDIRQSAASKVVEVPGCPSSNPDGTINICRLGVGCLKNESVKWDGNDECTTKLTKTSYCCTSGGAPTP